MQTENVCEWRSGSAANMIADQHGIWRPTLSDIKTAAIHGEIEMISEKLAYRKFIKDLEFETRKVFERENIEERKNIKNIETPLRMTRLDDKQMTRENIKERKKIKNIETRLRMTWLDDKQMTGSENISTHSKKHEPEVNLDPDPSSSDLSDSSPSDSTPKRKKS